MAAVKLSAYPTPAPLSTILLNTIYNHFTIAVETRIFQMVLQNLVRKKFIMIGTV